MRDVKFQHGECGTIYGIVREYGDYVEDYAKRGMKIVDCAISSHSFAVPENTPMEEIPFKGFGNFHETGYFWGGSEIDDLIALCQVVADIREEELPDDGKLHVHHQFSIGVADGSANYVVTKVMRKNCVIDWRAWCPDRWTDHHFGYGGQFRIDDIERYIRPNNLPRRGKTNPCSTRESFKILKTDWERRFGELPTGSHISKFLSL